MTTLFISDLHLSSLRPNIVEAFIGFLDGPAREAEAVYILGDLFELWLGDDAVLEEYLPSITAMKALADSGVPLYVMQGNRDFLLGAGFEAMTGATLLPDPYKVDLYGSPTLLMHGDLLCTDDIDYQNLRLMVRGDKWRNEFLAKTLQQRHEYVLMVREKSKQATRSKQETIMDVNQQAVEHTMREHGVLQLIHGHTHRPATHTFTLDGQTAQRIVLPEWYEQGGVLVCDLKGCQQLPL